jgi:hypothetical protein
MSIEIRLSCTHSLHYRASDHPPVKGSSIYCPRCVCERTVVSGNDRYRARCRDCAMSRKNLAQLSTARRAASNHVMKRTTHRVDIFNGDVLEITVTQDPNQGELPYDGDLADRLAFVADHQGRLRDHMERYRNVTSEAPPVG